MNQPEKMKSLAEQKLFHRKLTQRESLDKDNWYAPIKLFEQLEAAYDQHEKLLSWAERAKKALIYLTEDDNCDCEPEACYHCKHCRIKELISELDNEPEAA